ncbi:MAG: GNAT family N-acetyltransferase [Candidatus Competibacter sp.]|nr:GNAT family N-acetyltransferase [Candidatus Competibacter sp.]
MPADLSHIMPTSSLIDTKRKLKTPAEAVAMVKSGDQIYLGTGCATPRVLARALELHKGDLANITLFHFLTDGALPHDRETVRTRFQHRCFFVGMDVRAAVKQRQADYIPISIAQVPKLIDSGRLATDVAFVQVSPPDKHGYVSLGVSVDITRAVALAAKTIIAEINPHMPRTLGNSFLHLDQIHGLVPVDEPIIEYTHPPADAVAQQIARYAARIIDNNSTLQIGLGRIPNEMIKHLTDRQNLGIHSDVITDPIVDLIEKGVITGKAKGLHPGQIVTSYCLGTRRLYDLIDQNPLFAFHPIDYVCNPTVLAGNNQLVSVTQAFAVDLTGQVCADQFQGEFYSGVSTQPDFLRGAANSPGGKPIICLASTTDDGQESRIRPLLRMGEGVTVARSDVHYVITEYGCAYLFGKSIRERALALIEIAHPEFRPWLLEEAKRLGYVRPDQTLRSRVAYPVREERETQLKNGVNILIRPSKASDINGLQDFFHRLSTEDIYTRFFQDLKFLPTSVAEHLCNVDYETEMACVAVTGQRENEMIIGSACYFVNPTSNLAEAAYMIHPGWQGLGLGGILQQWLIEYARVRGLRGFTLEILTTNSKMIRLAKSAATKVSIERSGDTYEVVMIF